MGWLCTHQLKHVFVFWHNGELQHTLAAIHTNTQEEEREEIRCEKQPWSGESWYIPLKVQEFITNILTWCLTLAMRCRGRINIY